MSTNSSTTTTTTSSSSNSTESTASNNSNNNNNNGQQQHHEQNGKKKSRHYKRSNRNNTRKGAAAPTKLSDSSKPESKTSSTHGSLDASKSSQSVSSSSSSSSSSSLSSSTTKPLTAMTTTEAPASTQQSTNSFVDGNRKDRKPGGQHFQRRNNNYKGNRYNNAYHTSHNTENNDNGERLPYHRHQQHRQNNNNTQREKNNYYFNKYSYNNRNRNDFRQPANGSVTSDDFAPDSTTQPVRAPLNYFHDEKGNYFSSIEKLQQASSKKTSALAVLPTDNSKVATSSPLRCDVVSTTIVDYLTPLPPEIHAKIIEYLSKSENRALASTCLYFRSFCEEEFWHKRWSKMNLSLGSIGAPPFQPAPTTVTTSSGKEEEEVQNEEAKWTFGMLCKIGERTEQSWRGYRNYTEVKLLEERSETEVEMSANALVCTQDRSLLVAPFDTEVSADCCRDFHRKVKWQVVRNAHVQPISALRLTPNEHNALTASVAGEICLWNLETMKRERSFNHHTKAVETLDSFEDLIWSGGFEGKAVLCKKTSGEFLRSVDTHEARIWSIRCNSSTVAIGTGGRTIDKTLLLYDVETGKSKASVEGHAAFYDLQFEEDGTLFSASYDSKACLWDFRKKDPCVLSFEDIADEPLYCIQRRGWKLAVGTFHYSTIRLWDFRQAKCLRSFYVGGGKRSPMYSLCFDDSKLFATPNHSLYMLNFAC